MYRTLINVQICKLQICEPTDIVVYVKDLSLFVVKNTDEMDKLIIIIIS